LSREAPLSVAREGPKRDAACPAGKYVWRRQWKCVVVTLVDCDVASTRTFGHNYVGIAQMSRASGFNSHLTAGRSDASRIRWIETALD
jgi:hypothetical protein